jgi:flagellar basal-body rod protein FlgF/flagellar basal-body rod protein FlgG
VASHNLANLNTNGFRGQQTTFQSILALARPALSNVLNAATNNFGVLEGSHLNLKPGSLQETGNLLDVGIEGNGFFAVQTAQGARYTRNGNFMLARTGELTTSSGDPVLGENGVIRVPAGEVSISSDGTLSVNSAVAGKIRLVEFAPGAKVVSEGQSLLSAPESSLVPARAASVRQGALESSNVNAIDALMSLIGVQREFDMMQRALSLFHTEFNRIAANDLPKV